MSYDFKVERIDQHMKLNALIEIWTQWHKHKTKAIYIIN